MSTVDLSASTGSSGNPRRPSMFSRGTGTERPGNTMKTKTKAVVLLSGGLDSTTALAIAKSQEYEPYAMTFRYGQRHELEIEAAKRIASKSGVAEHVITEIDLRTFGGSALTSDIEVPKNRPLEEEGHGIPITYV